VSKRSEPPKPRFRTVVKGKSAATVVHLRIEELPTKTTEPGAGGWATSAAVKALICADQFSGAAKTLVASSSAVTKNRRTSEWGEGVGFIFPANTATQRRQCGRRKLFSLGQLRKER
jgi:hypothetical protein